MPIKVIKHRTSSIGNATRRSATTGSCHPYRIVPLKGRNMKKPSKKPKKLVRAKHKAAIGRPFPYEKVAELWAQEKTIPEIAKIIGRVGKGDDPYHGLRVVLTRMHKGRKDTEGNVIKLPHRVSRKTLRLATKAGKRAAS